MNSKPVSWPSTEPTRSLKLCSFAKWPNPGGSASAPSSSSTHCCPMKQERVSSTTCLSICATRPQHDRAFHKALNDLLKLRAERRREEAARDKASKAEILFAQRAEYNSLRAEVLRLKLKNQVSPKRPATAPAPEIGFVSQCSSEHPAAPVAATGFHLQEVAA